MQKSISADVIRRDRSQWYISQFSDAPRFENWFACGPTSLLMALADFGLASADEATRWALIQATKTVPGSGFPGSLELMAEYARRFGLEEKFKYTHDLQDIDRELDLGQGLILYGAMRVPAGDYVGHFVYLAGKDDQNHYIVGDPACPDVLAWTNRDLQDHMTHMTKGLKQAGFVAVHRKEAVNFDF